MHLRFELSRYLEKNTHFLLQAQKNVVLHLHTLGCTFEDVYNSRLARGSLSTRSLENLRYNLNLLELNKNLVLQLKYAEISFSALRRASDADITRILRHEGAEELLFYETHVKELHLQAKETSYAPLEGRGTYMLFTV